MPPGNHAAQRLRRLLLAVAAAEPPDIADIARDSDLDAFVAAADRHRILLLALDRLSEQAPLPPHLTDLFDHRRKSAHAARLHASRTYAAARDAAGSDLIVLKGLTLARFYEQPDLRECSDLDILVRRHDTSLVFDRLTEAGFEPAATNWAGFRRLEVAEFPLRYGATTVDLHWHLVALGRQRRAFRFVEDDLFGRAVDIDSAAGPMRALDATDRLIHRCVNTGLAGGRLLRDLVDVDRLVRSGEIDLDEFVVRARRTRSGALCAVMLQRCRLLLATPIPQATLDALTPSTAWLRANAWNDRRPRSRRSTSAGKIASGILPAAGRATSAETAAALASDLVEALAVRVGRRAKTDPGGPLDWQLDPGRHGELDRRAYLDWVAEEEDGDDHAGDDVVRRRCRDIDELRALLEPLEPRTSPTLGAATLTGLRGRTARADVWERSDGSVTGVLVRYRWTLAKSTGFPVILDPTATEPLARHIDRLGVTDLAGFEGDLEPLRDHLGRWRPPMSASAAVVWPDFTWDDAHPDVRDAGPDDIDAITELIWQHSPHAFVTRWLLRRRVTKAVDHLALVIDRGDPPKVVGACLRDSATARFHVWAHIVIDPDWHGEGLSWNFVGRGAAIAHRSGVGGIVFVVASNPMPIPSDALWHESWWMVALRLPRRIRGETRAREALDALLGATARRQRFVPAAVYREPGAADTLTSDRRTSPN